MDTVNKVFITMIVTRLAQPAKGKLKLYQIVLQMYVEKILALVMSKYLLYQVKMKETKNTLKDKNNAYYEKIEFTMVKCKQFKQKTVDYFVQLQSMHEETVSHKETPDLFCEPFIHTGFRPTNKPYSYYLKSLFKKHNETFNALSHYVGAIYCLTLLYRYDWNDAYSWPFITVVFTSVIMFVSSASAHLMHQKSHYCHMTCFLFDFTGISLHGFGSAFLQAYYITPTWYFKYIESTMMPLLGTLSMMCCLLNFFAQCNYKRPYPPIKRVLQFLPLGLLWIYAVFPIFLFLLPNVDHSLDINFKAHVCHICLFLFGAFVFALDIPQRYFPGCFDFIGQGHHIFHVCMFLVDAIQMESCYEDYLKNREEIQATRFEPSLNICFVSLAVLLVYDLYLVKMFRKMIAHNFDEHGNLTINDKAGLHSKKSEAELIKNMERDLGIEDEFKL